MSRPVPEPAAKTPRLLSLDVFRGACVVLMLLVNNPGDWRTYYAPLQHAAWHGFHLADLVFPGFMFIMGVAVVFGLEAVKSQPALHGRALRRVGRRVLVLVVLGLLIGLVPYFYFTSFRIPGVLQRLALVYGIGAVLFLKTTWRQQAALTAFLLVFYNVLLQVVTVPDYGPANLEPATNLGAWLDRAVFGATHLMNDQQGWDAESLLGLLPSVATGMLGLLAGQWLRQPLPEAVKPAWLFVFSAGALLAGLIWNAWFPINKALWTSSFVLYSGGLSGAGLAGLYFLLDVQGWRSRWLWLLQAAGSNALLVFFAPEVLERLLTRLRLHHPGGGSTFYARDWLYAHWRPFFTSPYHASLGWALLYTALWLGVLAVLYRRRVFFTA